MHHTRIYMIALAGLLLMPGAANAQLTADMRATLKTQIAAQCRTKAKSDPTFAKAAQQAGRDVAEPYCDCMGDKIAGGMNDGDLSAAKITPGAIPPSLVTKVNSYAQACIASSMK